MGTDIEYCGGNDAGEIVKLINNQIIAVSAYSLAEALVLGVKAGVGFHVGEISHPAVFRFHGLPDL